MFSLFLGKFLPYIRPPKSRLKTKKKKKEKKKGKQHDSILLSFDRRESSYFPYPEKLEVNGLLSFYF